MVLARALRAHLHPQRPDPGGRFCIGYRKTAPHFAPVAEFDEFDSPRCTDCTAACRKDFRAL